jgi:hypothetical protein
MKKSLPPQTKAEMAMHLKAQEMIIKFERHPTMPPLSSLFNSLDFSIQQVCKRGFIEPFKGMVDVYKTSANYKKYKEQFDKEMADYSKEELESRYSFISIEVPYKEVYGEDWKPDHIEYWGDTTFKVFIGKDFDKDYEITNWDNYAGVEASGRTFEEMIVNIGKKFFKVFGDFTENDFLTDAEKKNHEKYMPFYFKKCKDDRYSTMETNKKFKRVSAAEINRRWLKWFAGTDYGKENWGSDLKRILTGKNPNE